MKRSPSSPGVRGSERHTEWQPTRITRLRRRCGRLCGRRRGRVSGDLLPVNARATVRGHAVRFQDAAVRNPTCGRLFVVNRRNPLLALLLAKGNLATRHFDGRWARDHRFVQALQDDARNKALSHREPYREAIAAVERSHRRRKTTRLPSEQCL